MLTRCQWAAHLFSAKPGIFQYLLPKFLAGRRDRIGLMDYLTLPFCCANPECLMHRELADFLRLWGIEPTVKQAGRLPTCVIEIPQFWSENRTARFRLAVDQKAVRSMNTCRFDRTPHK